MDQVENISIKDALVLINTVIKVCVVSFAFPVVFHSTEHTSFFSYKWRTIKSIELILLNISMN